MRGWLHILGALAVMGLLLFVAGWYKCTVYSQCRDAGGGKLMCWHVAGKR
jgi:hypothetical protein